MFGKGRQTRDGKELKKKKNVEKGKGKMVVCPDF